jgi:group I intron endonuclease
MMLLKISKDDKKTYLCKTCKHGIVYKITNTLTGDFYIGSSTNLYKRYYTHVNHMKKGKMSCILLNRAAKKYGEENFSFEILVKCPPEYVLKLEQWFISNLNPKYNVAKIAGSNLGIKRTEEVKLKKSDSQKENWKDEAYRTKHLESLSKNWRRGSSHRMAKLTEEQVVEIKKQLASGLLPKQVSDNLKLSYYSIKDICRGKTWKNVTV